MALIHRVTRLFRADFNAVLDRIEEPEQLLRQAIRDMEEEIAAGGQRIALAENELETLAARRRELEASLAGYAEQLDLCFESGKDDLARGLIRRRLEAEALIARLESRRATAERNLAARQRRQDENRATLDSLRQKAALHIQTRAGSVDGPDDLLNTPMELRVGDDQVELAFLREQAARSGS